VAVACEAAQDLTGSIDRFTAVGPIEDETRAVLVPAISERWHAAVSRDLDAEPFTPA